jgi:quercetin dioxygenase-like cupin family protein
MKRSLVSLMTGVAMICGSAVAGEMSDTHRVFAPKDIQWSSGPPALPAGTEFAVLYGDPLKEAMFALRIKAPKGYRVPPHMHPSMELVTVISGRLRLGFGQSVDHARTQALPAGSFASIAPGVPHYMLAEEDSVFQISAIGPWGVDYVNPTEDPRLNGAPDPKSKLYSSEKRSVAPM